MRFNFRSTSTVQKDSFSTKTTTQEQEPISLNQNGMF